MHFLATIQSREFLHNLFTNRFILITLVIFLTRMKYATYRNIYVAALINIPGTLLHELSHFMVGGFLNAKPTSFQLMPRNAGDGTYVMGSVGFYNLTFYNTLPAALAPLSLLPFGYWVNQNLTNYLAPTLLNYVFYVLVQTILIENAIPSRTDIRVLLKHYPSIFFYIVVSIVGYYMYINGMFNGLSAYIRW